MAHDLWGHGILIGRKFSLSLFMRWRIFLLMSILCEIDTGCVRGIGQEYGNCI